MFIGTNVVQNSKPPFTVEYAHKWYEFGPNDPSEDYGKLTEGKPVRLQKPGEEPSEKAWSGKRPKAKSTIHDSAELLDACLADIKEMYGKDSEGKDKEGFDPTLVLLECASAQINLWKNNSIRQEMTPQTPIDADTALTRLVKTLKAANPTWSQEKVEQRAKLMLED